MPTQPTQPAKPSTPPQHPQQPPKPQAAPPQQPHKDQPKPDADKATHQREAARDNPAPMQTPVAGVAPPEPGLALGARPKDARDPQSAKFEAHAAPPNWNAPKDPPLAREEWTPDPALDARQQKPPAGYYADGMSAPDEQRARAAWVEAHGAKEYEEATDQRPADERPVFDKNALTGGAFVQGGNKRQVPGVVPPTKRE